MNSPDTSSQRRRVVFRGRVQGVGFRYQTQAIAARYPVRGFVQNQPDGTVLLVVEGQPGELNQVIEEIRLTMARYIQSDAVSVEQHTGEFQEFSIRR